MTEARADDTVRYEPHENPPPLIAGGAGLQAAMIIVAPVVLTVVIVARIAEQPESYLSWAVFAALLIGGVTTVLQAVRVGRVGAGHVLIMGTSGAFIAVCVTALVQGGPSMMASLIIVCRVGRRRVTPSYRSTFPSAPFRTGRAAFTASGSPVSRLVVSNENLYYPVHAKGTG